MAKRCEGNTHNPGSDQKKLNRPESTSMSRRLFLGVAGSAAGGVLVSSSLPAQQAYYPTIADSVRDFTASQGYNGWYYGYTVGQYSPDSFQLMSYFAETSEGSFKWLVDPANYLTRLSAEGGYPNGSDIVPGKSPQVHWCVRRWVSNVDDKIEVTGTLALVQPEASPDGITAYIYVDGHLLYLQTVDRNMPSSTFVVEFRVTVDTRVDFVVAPGPSSTGDGFLFTAQIARGGCQNCCHASPPVRYLQSDLPWGPLLYDHKLLTDPRNTIAHKGCALTCLSIALVYAGVGNTPGSLNTFMVDANCYEKTSHGVRWNDTVRAIAKNSGKTVEWRNLWTTDTAEFQRVLCASQDPTRGVFQVGHPIIVGVRRVPPLPGKSWKPQHFVLVTAMQIDPLGGVRFLIHDPARNATHTLSEFHSFEGRGYVVDPPDPLAGLNMDVANASLMVTDSAGLRTGFDDTTGAVNEIPGSVAFADALDDDISGVPAEGFCSTVNITQPSNGRFSVSVTVLTDGVHELSIRGYSDDGNSQPEVIVPINAPAGETISLEVQYESAPGSIPRVTIDQIVNIEVMLETISLNSKGLIPVAIQSTPEFDARDIDPLSVRFGPAEASEEHGKGHLEDTNGDGRVDLLLHFAVRKSGITADMTEVCLKGKTHSGTPIKGCAPIRVNV